MSLLRCTLLALVVELVRANLFPDHSSAHAVLLPSFVEAIPNVTVAVGREAILQCTIEDLGSYEVAWIKVDTETLLSFSTHVVPGDSRLRVANSNSDRTWSLHIKNVSVSDRGFYMCQINTDPMIYQEGFLDVNVPPSIIENLTSTDMTVEERSRVSLRCRASGYPSPQVAWRREDGKEINTGLMGTEKSAALTINGEYLNLTQVTRDDMGAYLCIASNGVQPAVSKRIMLQVNFQPKIRVSTQMVGAALGSDVVLSCKLEASPRPLTSWNRKDGMILLSSKKYELVEDVDSYRIHMQLKIKSLEDTDLGSYKCVARNMLGEKEGFVRLIEISPPTVLPHSTAPSDFYVPVHRGAPKTDFGLKKGYNIPAPNSLRDESQSLSSDKQMSSSKSSNDQENKTRQKQSQLPTQISQTETSAESQPECSPFLYCVVLCLVILSSLN